MNERDSEIIAQLLAPLGYILTDNIESAEMVVLNTCSIRDKAEQKVYSLLGQLRGKDSHHKKSSPIIVVAGCVAQQEGKKIFQRMPHVNIVIGTQQIYNLPQMLADLGQDKKNKYRQIAVDLSPSFAIPAFEHISSQKNALPSSDLQYKKFVTIMQGCNNFCTYCVVPFTRGREVSRTVEDIVCEVQAQVDLGAKEITLLGQNVNSYGQTNRVADTKTSFADLLYRVADVRGIKRLRFTTSNPHDLSDSLIDCFRNIDKLCPHFHLPVQSGSDRILQRMRRRYSAAEYLNKIEKLRAINPDIALSTDIIIGFPGEGDEDFQATMNLLKTVRFHSSFSFKYSDRPGTRSLTLPDKVDEKIKAARLFEFQQCQDAISLERNRSYINSKLEVMIEGCSKDDSLKGRTGTNHVVHIKKSDCQQYSKPGDIIEVLITKAGKHSLTGKVSST